MTGVSALNTNNPMVIILEDEFEKVRRLLMQYTKMHIETLVILNVCNIIFCISVMMNIPLLIMSEICVNLFMRDTLRKIHRECNLKQVGKIAFNQEYDIYDVNINDVYNSTRELACMRGKLTNIIYMMNNIRKFYIISTIIALVWSIIILVIKYVIHI